MNLSDAIRIRIYNLIEKEGINVWCVCKKSGIPCSTISTFLSGKTKLLKLDNILHICEAFDITLGEFFNDEVFKDVFYE